MKNERYMVKLPPDMVIVCQDASDKLQAKQSAAFAELVSNPFAYAMNCKIKRHYEKLKKLDPEDKTFGICRTSQLRGRWWDSDVPIFDDPSHR